MSKKLSNATQSATPSNDYLTAERQLQDFYANHSLDDPSTWPENIAKLKKIQGLVFDQLRNIEGRMLTTLEAVVTNEKQLAATKSLIRDNVWGFRNSDVFETGILVVLNKPQAEE